MARLMVIGAVWTAVAVLVAVALGRAVTRGDEADYEKWSRW